MKLCPSIAALLLCCSLSLSMSQAAPLPQRWQGTWGDGIRDGLGLDMAAAELGKPLRVHYWRQLDADWQKASIEFDVQAEVQSTSPLRLHWALEGDPDRGVMDLSYQPDRDEMQLHYQSSRQQGTMLMTQHAQTPAAEPALTPAPGREAVQLHLAAPSASKVYVAGEMNDWQADTLPMTQDTEGNWQLTLYLEPGKWAYKFVQDGRWIADPAAQAQSPDGSGGMNSLLQVGPIDQRYQPRANADERGSLQTLTVTSRRLGIQQLLIYRPAGSDPKKPLPWALMLHGYGMDRQQWVQDGQLPALLDTLIAEHTMPAMALLMVDGGKSFYQGDVADFLMQELLPQTRQWGLSDDPKQRAVVGMSMGGFGAFALAYQHPEAFAASLALSGYFDPARMPVLDAQQLARMPSTHFYCGKNDHISTATNQRLEQQLLAAGHPLPFDYAPGGHTWHYWQALMPQIMPPLARQLQPAPLP